MKMLGSLSILFGLFLACQKNQSSHSKTETMYSPQTKTTVNLNKWKKKRFMQDEWIMDTSNKDVDYEFYPNGNQKLIRRYNDNDAFPLVTNELFYDSLGRKKTEKKYNNYLPEGEEGFHATRIVVKETTFHPSGTIATIRFMKTCYECEECPCGWWKYYDSIGVLTTELPWGDCWDNQLECLD